MSKLFSPIALRSLALNNRVVVSPMCQYSAEDGSAQDWHVMHLGQLALSGAGLLIIEATAVEARGRISKQCLGLYSDDNEAALARVLGIVRRHSDMPVGIQLAHAGRKGSSHRPWEGRGPLSADEGAWQTVAPAAVPFAEGWHVPEALDKASMDGICRAFIDATDRAERLGFDLIELHAAHGYLLSAFLSPIANTRDDDYGGSLENRMRFPVEIVAAVREAWPKAKPLGVRFNGTDWVAGGITVDEAVEFGTRCKAAGADYVCISSGGNSPGAEIPLEPGYQVPMAARIKRETGLPTQAVGLIADPAHAEKIVAEGEADMVTLARAFLDDPRWTWHAAEALGADIPVTPQYERARPALWPGAKLLRPQFHAE